MNPYTLFFALLTLLYLTPAAASAAAAAAAAAAVATTAVGVTYIPPTASPQPSPEKIAAAIASLNIHSVRLPIPDPNLIRSFSYTNTSLLLSIPNSYLPALATNKSLATRWIYGHVLPFYPRSRISMISVGDDAVFANLTPFLLPAIRNVHLALRDIGIRTIAVSTTFSFVNVITTPFPPSSATFQAPLGEVVIKPLLQFLEDTNSSFLVNVFPYNMYRMNSEIPLGFALFQEEPFYYRDDVVTGVRYRNLFDMMVDSVITALAVAGHENMPVVVAETGWPSSNGGDAREVDATVGNAGMYLKGLVTHLRSGLGTPLRKEGVKEVYVFELFDEETVQGRREWGLLFANMSKKYDFDFSGGSVISVEVAVSMAFCLLVLVS